MVPYSAMMIEELLVTLLSMMIEEWETEHNTRHYAHVGVGSN
jgi:hypothetical protein